MPYIGLNSFGASYAVNLGSRTGYQKDDILALHGFIISMFHVIFYRNFPVLKIYYNQGSYP
jgi:hypothetical protein